MTPAPVKLLRLPAVRERLGGVSKVTIWRWRCAGKFPQSVELSPGCIAFIESEIDEFLAEKIAARDRRREVTP